MIYILSGKDIEKRNEYIKNLLKGKDLIRLNHNQISRDVLIEYAESVSLFGDSPNILVDNLISQGVIKLSAKDLAILKDSKSTFIFTEDSIKVVDAKKYKNYANIEFFEEKKTPQPLKFNTFAIADSFARRDKVNTWVLYCESIEKGIEPEAISGMLFWKIKTLLLKGSPAFSKEELKRNSSEIVSLYHKAHLGECDFVIGIEQFILNALSK